MKGPAPIPPLVAALAVVGFLFAIGYSIYSKILKQMAINAKNKRIIKSPNGQAENTVEANGDELGHADGYG